LEICFRDVKHNKNVTIDGPTLQAQALKFETLLGETDFTASNGWLDGFKKRYEITWKKCIYIIYKDIIYIKYDSLLLSLY
jgi:hypothetical protein